MTTGGKILIKTKSQKNKVELYISDTGSGISNYIQDRIFEPFFTTKGVVGMGKDFGSQDLEGTGLGLSVSLGIIEAHGGKIKLLKSSKKGTTFKITLPIAIDTDKER
jgi:signal transduction histidine kinase